jgi:hypothetical protein
LHSHIRIKIHSPNLLAAWLLGTVWPVSLAALCAFYVSVIRPTPHFLPHLTPNRSVDVLPWTDNTAERPNEKRKPHGERLICIWNINPLNVEVRI